MRVLHAIVHGISIVTHISEVVACFDIMYHMYVKHDKKRRARVLHDSTQYTQRVLCRTSTDLASLKAGVPLLPPLNRGGITATSTSEFKYTYIYTSPYIASK